MYAKCTDRLLRKLYKVENIPFFVTLNLVQGLAVTHFVDVETSLIFIRPRFMTSLSCQDL